MPPVLEWLAWLLVNPHCSHRAPAGAQELKLVLFPPRLKRTRQSLVYMQVCSVRGEILKDFKQFA